MACDNTGTPPHRSQQPVTPPHTPIPPGALAETVLLPGDPDRAVVLAEMLEAVQELPTVRGQRAFTGRGPGGARISVHSTGMGIPSLLIFAEELIQHGARRLVRVGTCGTQHPDVALGDMIIATSADVPPSLQSQARGIAAVADPDMTQALGAAAVREVGTNRVWLGPVQSTDMFYPWHKPPGRPAWGSSVLGVEMEAAGLFLLARLRGVKAAAIMTVTDLIDSETRWPPDQRAHGVATMLRAALEAARSW